ncbi:MAG: acetate/propionate family kinase, partial [Dehalococcoidia bacterium]
MEVLAINCGSSSLKFDLIEISGQAVGAQGGRRLAHGNIQRIGSQATIEFDAEAGTSLRDAATIADHGEATEYVLGWLADGGLPAAGTPAAVGHRVVHGGEQFVQPTLIDDQVTAAIEALAELAPLHNVPALAAIRAARTVLGPAMPMVATFDTAFHHAMPERAARYAIPRELADRHRIRRYGFHGLAHRFMTERCAALAGAPAEQLRLITLQLGNGCSAAAVAGGRSVDTSMGSIPLEGLIMGTRSGDIDPSLPGFLAEREGAGVQEVERWLNTRSGLLGVSGHSQDMRDLLNLEHQGDD